MFCIDNVLQGVVFYKLQSVVKGGEDMEKNVNISDAEMKVMNKIWEMQGMVTVQEMVEILNEEGEEWAYQTVATFLRRLEVKGVLSSTKKAKKLSYFPLISKEQYEKKEAKWFIDSKFSGSLRNFLVAFSGNKKLGENDIKELKDWLNEFDD